MRIVLISMLNRPLVEAFGNRIRTLRTGRNLSQEKLAELTGFHRTYIGMIELGMIDGISNVCVIYPKTMLSEAGEARAFVGNWKIIRVASVLCVGSNVRYAIICGSWKIGCPSVIFDRLHNSPFLN